MKAALVMAVALAAGCSTTTTQRTPPPGVWGANVPEADAATVAAQPVVARRNGFITLLPISPTGGVVGVDYGYAMPHCGTHSPIDVDGSFWDALPFGGDPVTFDGATGTFRLTSPVTASFTDTSGRVLRLVRHTGAK